MITDSVSSASSAAASGLTSTLTGTGSTTLGKDDFLKLLTAQLQHQDPLQPMDNTAFVAQLAQFSSLEQLQNMNSSLSTDILLNQSVNNSLATGLIGRNIVAKGDQITLAAGGTADLSFNLSAAADAKITVVDSSGKTVATLTPGHLGAGDQTVTWNGLGSDGKPVPAGDYHFQVTATGDGGAAVTAETLVRGRVTGVKFDQGVTYLMVGTRSIGLSDVVQIEEAGAGS